MTLRFLDPSPTADSVGMAWRGKSVFLRVAGDVDAAHTVNGAEVLSKFLIFSAKN